MGRIPNDSKSISPYAIEAQVTAYSRVNLTTALIFIKYLSFSPKMKANGTIITVRRHILEHDHVKFVQMSRFAFILVLSLLDGKNIIRKYVLKP